MDLSSEQSVLAAALAGGVAVIDEVTAALSEWHFADPVCREIFVAMRTFRSVASGVLTPAALRELSRESGADAGSAALAVETFEALWVSGPDSSAALTAARWAASRVRSDANRRSTAAALADASEIVSGSVQDADGVMWSGPDAAREWAQLRFAEVEAECGISEGRAGVVTGSGGEASAILNSYAAAHAAVMKGEPDRRVRFGLPAIDDVLGGVGPGELVIIGGPQGAGKSQTLVHLAHNAITQQGLNVFFATSETVRETVRARMVARHSRSPQMEEARQAAEAPEGLDSGAIKRGLLPVPQLALLRATVMDLCSSPDERGYGMFHLAQVPYRATMASVGTMAAAADRRCRIDIIIVDYLALLSPARRYAEVRNELSSTILEGKSVATTFRRNEGVPVVSPWQISRSAQEELARSGGVELRSLADTSEIERSSDIIIFTLPDGARDRHRYQNMRLLIGKNRDGQIRTGDDALSLRMDYATSTLSERTGAVDSFGNGSGDMGTLASLVPSDWGDLS